MSKIVVNVINATCPIPVVEVRKALRKVESGDEIEVIGNNENSKKEIQMLISAAGKNISQIIEDGNQWKIIIKC